MKWFRLYNEVLDDPKIQKLSPELFKFWINLLCLASKNKGKLPPISDIAFALRMPLEAAQEALFSIERAQLLQKSSNQHSTTLAPYNWEKRQYKSDASTQRVKRFRNARRNVAVTPPDTDTDKQKKKIKNKKKVSEKFDLIKNYDIKMLLNDSAFDRARKVAPGWDLYYLMPVYNSWMEGKIKPTNPPGAFISWCASYTKNKSFSSG